MWLKNSLGWFSESFYFAQVNFLQFDKHTFRHSLFSDTDFKEELWQGEYPCFSVPSLDSSIKIGLQKIYEMKEVFLIISRDEARESQHNGEGGFFPSPQCSLNVIEGAERK